MPKPRPRLRAEDLNEMYALHSPSHDGDHSPSTPGGRSPATRTTGGQSDRDTGLTSETPAPVTTRSPQAILLRTRRSHEGSSQVAQAQELGQPPRTYGPARRSLPLDIPVYIELYRSSSASHGAEGPYTTTAPTRADDPWTNRRDDYRTRSPPRTHGGDIDDRRYRYGSESPRDYHSGHLEVPRRSHTPTDYRPWRGHYDRDLARDRRPLDAPRRPYTPPDYRSQRAYDDRDLARDRRNSPAPRLPFAAPSRRRPTRSTTSGAARRGERERRWEQQRRERREPVSQDRRDHESNRDGRASQPPYASLSPARLEPAASSMITEPRRERATYSPNSELMQSSLTMQAEEESSNNFLTCANCFSDSFPCSHGYPCLKCQVEGKDCLLVNCMHGDRLRCMSTSCISLHPDQLAVIRAQPGFADGLKMFIDPLTGQPATRFPRKGAL